MEVKNSFTFDPAVPVLQTLEQLNNRMELPSNLEFGTAPIPQEKTIEPVAARIAARRVRRNPVDQSIQVRPGINKRADNNAASLLFFQKCMNIPLGEIIGSVINMFDTKLGVQGLPTINNANVSISSKKNLVTNSHNGTVDDELLGPLNAETICVKCGQLDCQGHYGHISFHGVPVMHPYKLAEIVYSLKCVCHCCSTLLINEAVYKQNGFHTLPPSKVLAALAEYCENIPCHPNEKTSSMDNAPRCAKNAKLDTSFLKEKGSLSKKYMNTKAKQERFEPFPNTEIYNILNKISDKEAHMMGFRNGNHPRHLFLFSQLVPPRGIRATEYVKGEPQTNSFSAQLSAITRAANPEVRDGRVNIDPGIIFEAVNNLYNGKKTKKGNKNATSIKDTIQGRDAMLRKTIQGKRNDKSARGVAGPGTHLEIDQIGIPRKWMNKITKPVTVNEMNIDYCRELLRTRRIKKIKTTSGNTQYVRYNDPPELRIGDIIYRYLQDDDRVCANRQPTLHRNSLLSYRIVGHASDTVTFHEDVLGGMNMDRDGDEGNVWFIQEVTEESEGEIILSVKENIMSREQARPVISCIMNASTGSYVLTGYNFKEAYPIEDYEDLENILIFKDQLSTLDERLRKYAIPKNSGYGIFSMCLPKDLYYEEGPVKIVEGVMISGRIVKKNIGSSEMSIVQIIHKVLGSEEAFRFLCNCPRLINKWVMEHGFSVSITDFFNSAIDENGMEYNTNETLLRQELDKMYTKLEIISEEYSDHVAEQERQRKIGNILNSNKSVGDTLAKENLTENNQIRIMTDKGAGTKGATANIAQMMGAVGQQFYRGERIKTTLTNGTRTIPVFYPGDPSPLARGFIEQSFFTGMDPAGLFFTQSASREGILDTALNVSLTGYIQRSMAKSFENLVVANDGSVRNTNGAIFSMIYGSCGFDIGQKVKLNRGTSDSRSTFLPLQEIVREINNERGFVTSKENREIEQRRRAYEIPYDGINPDQEIVALKSFNSKPLTRYEKSRIIGARAKQLEDNAPPLIDPGTTVSTYEIAKQEYNLGILKIGVLRKFGDGTSIAVYPTPENIKF